MDRTPQPEITPLPAAIEEALPGGLIEANRMLDGLAGGDSGHSLAEHVEVFEVVHHALADALAETEA